MPATRWACQCRSGRIQARSSGWIPAMELDDVVPARCARPRTLRAAKVSAALSVSSLLSMQLRFRAAADRRPPRLEVRRDAQGGCAWPGWMSRATRAGEGGALADRFFQQHEFVIRGGVLRWVDELRDGAAAGAVAGATGGAQPAQPARSAPGCHPPRGLGPALHAGGAGPPAAAGRAAIGSAGAAPCITCLRCWCRSCAAMSTCRSSSRGRARCGPGSTSENGLPKGGTSRRGLARRLGAPGPAMQPLELAQVNGPGDRRSRARRRSHHGRWAGVRDG